MNNCTFIGNLTHNPERVTTQSGKTIARFSIAIRYNKDNTDFFDFQAWDSTAEFILTYFKKGDKIGVECTARQDKWKTPEGENRSKVIFNANKAHFCNSGKKEKEEVNKDNEEDNVEVPANVPF